VLPSRAQLVSHDMQHTVVFFGLFFSRSPCLRAGISVEHQSHWAHLTQTRQIEYFTRTTGRGKPVFSSHGMMSARPGHARQRPDPAHCSCQQAVGRGVLMRTSSRCATDSDSKSRGLHWRQTTVQLPRTCSSALHKRSPAPSR